MRNVAFLVDGTFFIKRYLRFVKNYYSLSKKSKIPDILETIKLNNNKNPYYCIVSDLTNHCLKHLENDLRYRDNKIINERIYRIFFYDCPPLSKKVHHPQTKKSIDLSKTSTYTFRNLLYEQIKQSRHFALRLGVLDEKSARWKIKDIKLEKAIITSNKDISSLIEDDFIYHANQKEVDIKIGLDIASITYKKLADKIVLITGDSDFVPAAKLSRREGVEFILDTMGAKIKPSLQEHVDGLNSPPFKFHINTQK